MDKSPHRQSTKTDLQATRIHVPSRPLSPWPRLAVRAVVSQEHALHLAYRRRILDYEFVYLESGTGWVWCDSIGSSIDLVPGDLVFFPPGFVHGWASETNVHLAFHFDLHARPKIRDYDSIQMLGSAASRTPGSHGSTPRFELAWDQGDPLTIPLVTKVRDPEQWKTRLYALIGHYNRRTHQSPLGLLAAQEMVAWGLRTLAEDARDAQFASAGPLEPGIARALAAADQRWLSVRELAAMANMGQTTFRKKFLSWVGRPPREYLEEVRITRSKHLLVETERPIHQIAEICGYHDPYHFSRVFARVVGQSPRSFRHARVR